MIFDATKAAVRAMPHRWLRVQRGRCLKTSRHGALATWINRHERKKPMNRIVYIVGAIVIIVFLLGFLGLR